MSTTELSLSEFSTIAQACAMQRGGMSLADACELLAVLSVANCEAVTVAYKEETEPHKATAIEAHAAPRLLGIGFGKTAHAAGKILASLVYNCDAQINTDARRDALIALQTRVMRALIEASPFEGRD